MNKTLLQHIIVERLSSDLLIAQRAAQTAYEAATDVENIAENKYDTLGSVDVSERAALLRQSPPG